VANSARETFSLSTVGTVFVVFCDCGNKFRSLSKINTSPNAVILLQVITLAFIAHSNDHQILRFLLQICSPRQGLHVSICFMIL
jgi:hypothetical protein